MKVVCLGLCRTGTSSLREALETLGFGPCYHMRNIIAKDDPVEIDAWLNIGQGKATLGDLQTLLKDYNSVLDIPAAIYFEKLYKAYPDAKFILTIRDPAEWEVSMKNTVLKPSKFPPKDPNSFRGRLRNWYQVEFASYHQGKIFTDTQGVLLAHNQRVMQLIPADKLLIYEVNQGWEPLVNFLGVEKPDLPFPHLNDTAEFQKRFALGSNME